MKTIQAFIIGITILVGVAGCSTPNPKVARSQHQVSDTAAIVEDARLLYEAGRLDDAQHKLEAALKLEPDNRKARYYLALVYQSRAKIQERENEPAPKGYYPTYPPKLVY